MGRKLRSLGRGLECEALRSRSDAQGIRAGAIAVGKDKVAGLGVKPETRSQLGLQPFDYRWRGYMLLWSRSHL